MSQSSRRNPATKGRSPFKIDQPSLFDCTVGISSVQVNQTKINREPAGGTSVEPSATCQFRPEVETGTKANCTMVGEKELSPSPQGLTMTRNMSEQHSSVGIPSPTVMRSRATKPLRDNMPLHFGVGAENIAYSEMPRHVWFRIVNDHPKIGDRQPLRMLWQVAECAGINIKKLDLDVANLTALLKINQLHNNPKRYARQILICLDRVLKEYPELLTKPYDPVVDTRLHPVSVYQTPVGVKKRLADWLEMTPIKLAGQPNPANALVLVTINTYVASVRTILAGLQLGGVRLDPNVDFAFIVQPNAIARWLPVLKQWSARGTVRGHLAALLRIAGDLPEIAPSHITYLRARLAEIMDDLSLDADQLSMVASWTEPKKHACLLSAPDVLMTTAENPSATSRTRILNGASGFAFQLMWEHPGLTERAIAEFDTDKHIVGDPGSRTVLRLHPASRVEPERWVPERMSPDAESLLDRLLAARKSMSVTETLLLPGMDGRPRETRAAMEVLYNKIQGVLSERLTSSDFRDINAYIGLDDKDADLPELAAALGYADERSLERRFSVHAHRNPGAVKP